MSSDHSDQSEGEDNQPQIRKRAPEPVDQDEQGKSSVMPSTMAAAEKASENFTQVASVLGEAAGSVAAHQAHSRMGPGAAALASGVASMNDQTAFLASHAAVVQKGGDVGRVAGGLAGASASEVIKATARRIGAHQCDVCGKQNLYNYYTCDNPAVAAGGKAANLDTFSYDLCSDCYAKFTNGTLKGVNLPPGTTFSPHNNAQYTLKLLGGALVGLLVLRFLVGRIF